MSRALRSRPIGSHPVGPHPIPCRPARHLPPGGSAVGHAAVSPPTMGSATTKPPTLRTLLKPRTQIERPRLHKVILLNDDYTPRDFVVVVLKSEFRMTEDQAHRVMITAHRRGACVVGVFTRDVAETKATRATDMAKAQGFPLLFTTEPEE